MSLIQHNDGIPLEHGIQQISLAPAYHLSCAAILVARAGDVFETDGITNLLAKLAPTSSDTRFATETAATRRGCVQPTIPSFVKPPRPDTVSAGWSCPIRSRQLRSVL